MRLGTLAIFTAAALGACAARPPGPPGVPQMGVRTYFGIEHVCSLGVSPPILLDGAPANAARYRVRFTNTSVLWARAMEYEVPGSGREIAPGAIDGYRGPCPGETEGFTLRVEVLALDAAGRAMAYGQTGASVQNPGRLARAPESERPRMPPPPDRTRR